MTPREEHINKIKKIQETMRELVKGSPHYKDLQRQLNKLKSQLRIYDELKGYKTHKFYFAICSRFDKTKFFDKIVETNGLKTIKTTSKPLTRHYENYNEAQEIILQNEIINQFYVIRIKKE